MTGHGPVPAVAVEGVGGVRHHGVGLEARGAWLDGAAVRAVAARVVQRRLQPGVPDGRVRHAPARVRVTGAFKLKVHSINDDTTRQ